MSRVPRYIQRGGRVPINFHNVMSFIPGGGGEVELSWLWSRRGRVFFPKERCWFPERMWL